MPGRKRKPANLKEQQGTFRKDRDNENKPMLPVGVPNPPDWLPKGAYKYWDTLVKQLDLMRVISEVDQGMASMCALREYEIEQLTEDIEENGLVLIFRDAHGVETNRRKNPAVGARSDAMRHRQVLLAEFGLSPAARSKVSTNPKKEEKKNPFSQRA